MSKTPLDICKMFGQDNLAKYIGHTWHTYHSGRNAKISEWKELRNYIFATDTTTTTNKSLPWKNSTTIPKLCQIRDNLHSNYLSALFPNDDWLTWVAYNPSAARKAKRDAIQSYMSNKTREGGFRRIASQLLYDYIDYGVSFAMPEFISSMRKDVNGHDLIDFIGPKAVRISPLDIEFNPIASSFQDSWKIIRSVKSQGELHAMALDMPENAYLQEALKNRNELKEYAGRNGIEDLDKNEGFQMDGFNHFSEYLQSGYVEFLDFYGDIYNDETGVLLRGHIVTVVDRMWVVRNEPIPSWLGTAPIYMVGWRTRPDNLWAMGPLDNLVGMQYRIDHLENIKADAMDLAVLPPIVIQGPVEEFQYGPGAEIHADEGGSVTELGKNVQWVIASDNAISTLEQRMEMYAGAPREAMGIRTAGEKTAFEVQQLQNAAGRIFQEKITTFETELLEPLLNSMLETARRNLDGDDVIRVIDTDLGATEFRTITKDDITANGVIRPIGARHFAAQAQLLQNLTGVYNTPLGQMIAPHTSAIAMSEMVADILGVQRFKLYRPNVAVFEQQETQRLMNQAGEDLEVEQATPVDGGLDAAEPV